MSCLPGSPCFTESITSFTSSCGVDPCNKITLGTESVFYTGPNLPCTGINPCDSLTTALSKIDDAICNPPTFTFTANNGLTKTLSNVQLGGPLIQQTVITTSFANTLSLLGLVSDPNPAYFLSENSSGVIRKTAFSPILPITADNGLTMSTSTNVQLGGTLIKNTNVELDSYDIKFLDTTTSTGIYIQPGSASESNFTTNTTQVQGKLKVTKQSWFDENMAVGPNGPSLSSSGGNVRLLVTKVCNLGDSSFPCATNSILGLNNGTDVFSYGYSALQGNLYIENTTPVTYFNVPNVHTAVSGLVNFSGEDTALGALSCFTASSSFGWSATGDPMGDLETLIGFQAMYPQSRAISTWPQTLTNYVGLQIEDSRTQMTGGVNGTITNSYGIKQLGPDDSNIFYGSTYIQPDNGTTYGYAQIDPLVAYLQTGLDDTTDVAGTTTRVISFRSSAAMILWNYNSSAFNAQAKYLIAHPWIGTMAAGTEFQILDYAHTVNLNSATMQSYYDERVGSPFWNESWDSAVTSIAPVNPIPFPGWVNGDHYTLRTKEVGDNFPAGMGTTVSGTPNTSGWVFISNGTPPTTWTNGSIIDGDYPVIDLDARNASVVTDRQGVAGAGRVGINASRTDIDSKLRILNMGTNIPVFLNEAAATGAGLTSGDVYRIQAIGYQLLAIVS